MSNIKKNTLFLLVSASLLTLAVGCADSQKTPDTQANSLSTWPALTPPALHSQQDRMFVENVLSRMSTEEKVGQILQAEIQTITPREVRDYHIGSVLNGGSSDPNRNPDADAAEWARLAEDYFKASMDTSDGYNAIPVIWGTDAVHGHNNIKGATLFPHNIGLGATRNPVLIRQIGQATAAEVRATGVRWAFAPTVAVVRNDRWGRTYESYSENPDLVAELTTPMILGLQGEPGTASYLDSQHVAATAKHFLGDGGTTDGDDQGDTRLSEQQLVRIHNPGYVSAINAGVQTIMASFNSFNGVKMHGNPALLTDALKQQMAFDGLVVGDWNGHGQVPGCTNSDCPASINAGIDLIMVPYDWKEMYGKTLSAVETGAIPMARLDDAVRRILLVKKQLGLFDDTTMYAGQGVGDQDRLGTPAHRAIARQAVRESLVLLKNNQQVLPVQPGKHILVTGPGANNIAMQSGGWSVNWQGTELTNGDFVGATSVYEGIQEVAKQVGSTAELSNSAEYQKRPDVAIVVFGESPYAEGQGDINTLEFEAGSKDSLTLLRSLKSQNIPVVALFLSGRPLWVNPELNASDAFVAAWLPGSEGAGIADVLLADKDGRPGFDFRGKLSFSWPKRPDQFTLNVGDADYDPLFAYGFGLTYQDKDQIKLLPEKVKGVTSTGPANLALYVGRPLQPWHMVIENNGQNQSLSGGFVRLNDETMTLTTSDKELQEDALTLTFTEARDGSLHMAHGQALDLTSYLKTGTLEFDINVDDVKKAGLRVAISCGPDCRNSVDLWSWAKSVQGKGWQNLSLPLTCFNSEDADFSAVSKPFDLKLYGSGQLSLANVRINVQGAGNFDCPDQDRLSITPDTLNTFWAEEWWMPRHKQKLQAPERSGAELLLVGDSITHGWEQTGSAVWQAHFADIQTLNLGFSGDRTENVIWRFANGELNDLSPKMAMIMIGTNNTGHRFDRPQKIRDGVAAIIDQLQSRIPDTEILLVAIFPRGEKPDDVMRQNNAATNRLLEALASDKGILFADFNNAFLSPDGNLSKEIMPDLLHPNKQGYQIWAQQLTPYIDKYIRDRQ